MSADSAVRTLFAFLELLTFFSFFVITPRRVGSTTFSLGFHGHFDRDLERMKFLAPYSALFHTTLVSGWFVKGRVPCYSQVRVDVWVSCWTFVAMSGGETSFVLFVFFFVGERRQCLAGVEWLLSKSFLRSC